MENLDPQKNPWTSIPGYLLFFAGFVLWILPLFITLKEDISWWQWGGAMLIGFLLVVAPDEVVKDLLSLFKRKTDQL